MAKTTAVKKLVVKKISSKDTKVKQAARKPSSARARRTKRVKPYAAAFSIEGPPIYLQSLQNAAIRFLGVDDMLASFLEYPNRKPSVSLLYDSRPDHGDNRTGPFPQPVVRAIRAPREVSEFLLHVQVWNNPRNPPPNPWSVHYEVGEMIQGRFVPIHVGDLKSGQGRVDVNWALHMIHWVKLAA